MNKEDLENYCIDFSRRSAIVPIIVILVLLVSTVCFFGPMEMNNQNELYPDVIKRGFINDFEDACEFIKNNDSDYHNKTFATTNHFARTARWYLNTNVTLFNPDKNHVKDYDNATYLILNSNRNYHNYHVIERCGDFNIYLHN